MRFAVSLPVVYSWRSAGAGRGHGAGQVHDVSSRGLFVTTDFCPPTAAKVRCELMLPSLDATTVRAWLHVSTAGRVVRSESHASSGSGFAVLSEAVVLRQWEGGLR